MLKKRCFGVFFKMAASLQVCYCVVVVTMTEYIHRNEGHGSIFIYSKRSGVQTNR